MQVPTIRVKPWGEDQGEFVVINADDFDPEVHTMHEGEAPPKTARKAKAKE